MKPFVHLDGVAAPLPVANLDTDQIVPKQFLKTVDRVGLGRALFFDLRYDESGHERADFVLNRAAFCAAEILVAGPNFGCGSSREHAPWALLDFGIRCVVAESFADIFCSNCFENGILPVVLEAASIASLVTQLDGRTVAVDLPSQTIVAPDGAVFTYAIAPDRKDKLLRGVDAIDATLAHEDAISAYEQRRDRP